MTEPITGLLRQNSRRGQPRTARYAWIWARGTQRLSKSARGAMFPSTTCASWHTMCRMPLALPKSLPLDNSFVCLMPPETLVLNDTRYLQIQKANCKLMSKQR